jgi:hypothetical protein
LYFPTSVEPIDVQLSRGKLWPGCWLAALVCALPAITAGQDPLEELPTLPAPADVESWSRPAEELPRLSPSVPNGPVSEPAIGTGTLEVPSEEAPRANELMGSQLLGPGPMTPLILFPFGYNLRQSDMTWLVGGGDTFGMFSLESYPTLDVSKISGIVVGSGFHFLAGPVRTDMPPRLFDFQIGYQRRQWTSDTIGYDIAARVGAFSDFEGSARKGIRFPAHAVGYYRCSPQLDVAFGVDYLDRDDISLLPVFGLILTPRDDLRLELVFPRPRIEVQISPKRSLYLAGELGGGTWAIERTTMTNDVVTYRDLKLLFGIASWDAKGGQGAIEIGYVFGRDLSYRSGLGEYAPPDTFLIRSTTRY